MWKRIKAWWRAKKARKIIEALYKPYDTRGVERTTAERHNRAQGGLFQTGDIQNNAYREAVSGLKSQYTDKTTAFQTLLAYYKGIQARLGSTIRSLQNERSDLEDQLAQARFDTNNNVVRYDHSQAKLRRGVSLFLVSLIFIAAFTFFDFSMNSARLAFISNARLDTFLLTAQDIFNNTISVAAISFFGNLLPVLAGNAFHKRTRGKKSGSTIAAVGVLMALAFFAVLIIPAQILGMPEATSFQILMAFMPMASTIVGFFLPSIIGRSARRHELNPEECEAAIESIDDEIAILDQRITDMGGELTAAHNQISNGFLDAQQCAFDTIDSIIARFTTNYTQRRPTSNSRPTVGQQRIGRR
ncbi:hypothetical protein FWC63_02265 [Candidatus Saccharibacteria bacterium]|nr:hypothetical protein [Candidatus Saccharibacteria bacterium]